jgi:LacI family transcriptional regulator
MKPKRVTSFDVARHAGVSRSTVSLVLNDVRSVAISKSTRERVMEAAQELKYVPHAAGRALASQRTMNIGFVYAESQVSHDFLLQFMQGLALAASSRNLRLLTDIYKDGESFNGLLTLTRAKHIDGLIMTEPRTGDPVLHQLAEEGFPAVLIGSLPSERLCSIDIDNAKAAERVTEHLFSLGHRRIACVTNAPIEYTAASTRLDGYRRVLTRHGIPYDDKLVRFGNFTAESGYRAMAELIGARMRPTAVFAASDTVAFGVMRAIRESGLQIPEQVAVAGFDDIPLSRYASPPLTTVHFPAIEEGQMAAEMLVEVIEGRVLPGHRLEVETRLVIRQSSGVV